MYHQYVNLLHYSKSPTIKSLFYFCNGVQARCRTHPRVERWALCVFAQHLSHQPTRVAALAKRMRLRVPTLLLRRCLLHVQKYTRDHLLVPVVENAYSTISFTTSPPGARIAERWSGPSPPVLQRAPKALGGRREKRPQAALPPVGPRRAWHVVCTWTHQRVLTMQQRLVRSG